MKRTEALDILADFAEKTSNPDNFEFDEVASTIQKTVLALKQYPDVADYIDFNFPTVLKEHYDGNFSLEYTQIFALIMQQKSTEEQKAYLHRFSEVNPNILESFEDCAIKQNPELLDDVFANRVRHIYKNGNHYSFTPHVMNLVEAAPNAEKCEKMLRNAFNNCVFQDFRDKNIMLLPGIYNKYPQLLDTVFDIVKNEKRNRYYMEALADIAVFDESKAEEVLSLMHEHILQSPRESSTLQIYYANLKKIGDAFPRFKQLAQSYGREALQFDENCETCKKLAARLLGDEDILLSHIFIGEKVKKSSSNNVGYQRVTSVGPDETCVLFIGGNGALDDRAAKGYIKPVAELIKRYKMSKKVNVYGLSYDFGDFFNTGQALEAQMKKYGHRPVHRAEYLNNMHRDTENPQFIKQIFDKFILPRISLLDGKVRLSAQEAARKMNKLKIVAHCLGGYVALKLEELSLQTMEQLGYTPDERLMIQKQMQVVAMNPYCPLGVQKSDMFSLISAQDRDVTHNNFFEKFVRHQVNKGKIIPLSYFEPKLGNFILVNRMYGSDNRRNNPEDRDEHGYFGFQILPAQSEKGKMAMKFIQNVLINGLKSALRDEIRTLTTPEMLVSSPQDLKNLYAAYQNGKDFYAQAVEYTLAENNKKQKDK